MTILLLLRPRFSEGAPAPAEPGGGGMGAVMSPAFFQRYHARYESKAPESRYKPTLRKQR